MTRHYRSVADLSTTIPVFPLSGALLLPHAPLPLNIFEPRYLAMIDAALGSNRLVGMIQPEGVAEHEVSAPPIYKTGCVGRLTSYSETEDGRYLITLTGICRFHVDQELDVTTPYRQVIASYTGFDEDLQLTDNERILDRERLMTALQHYFNSNDLRGDWDSIQKAPAETLINSLAMICPFAPTEKQALLEAATPADRADVLITLIEMAGAADTNPSSGVQ